MKSTLGEREGLLRKCTRHGARELKNLQTRLWGRISKCNMLRMRYVAFKFNVSEVRVLELLRVHCQPFFANLALLGSKQGAAQAHSVKPLRHGIPPLSLPLGENGRSSYPLHHQGFPARTNSEKVAILAIFNFNVMSLDVMCRIWGLL